jgi:glycerophosphoryl diester phosphodiesterase
MRGSLFFIALIVFGCNKTENFENIQLFGHAGTGLENVSSVYHDNTLESVLFALSMQGCEGVEVDVHLSASGDLWLFHDAKLETETNLSGCIPDLFDEVLSTGKYSTLHQEKLAKLSDIDTAFLQGKSIVLDLRHYNECVGEYVNVAQIIDRLVDLGYASSSGYNVLVNVSRYEWIQPFIDANFDVVMSIYSMSEFNTCENAYPDLHGYIMKNSDVTKENVATVHQSAKKLFIFEVRSPKMTREALRKSPDAILSDDLRTAIIEKY